MKSQYQPFINITEVLIICLKSWTFVILLYGSKLWIANGLLCFNLILDYIQN